ncbi:MAG: Zn-dependent hydrolase [Streptosporangiales bacterium]
MAELAVDRERLRSDFESLATFGRQPGGGVDRPSFSDADSKARAWLTDACAAHGFTVREDPIGNLFIRLEAAEPSDATPVWTGSHIDSVPNGGRFDGAVGVLAAIEVIRRLREERVPLRRPVDAVVWTDEEGCFQGLLGSTAATQGIRASDLGRIVSRDGVRLRQAMRDTGRDPDAIPLAKQQQGVPHAYLELHIEQGSRLELAGADIGVVTTVVGLGTGQVTFHGRADHAGTTAMDRRRDALQVAAAFVCDLARIPANVERPEATATCGNLHVLPGADNIVPATATCRLDLRDPEPGGVSALEDAVIALAHETAARYAVTVDYERDHLTHPVDLDPALQDLLAARASKLGYDHFRLPSGAGHDAQNVATIAPAAMVFVPSKDGRSHCPEEYTSHEQLACGADVLLNAVAELGVSH